MGEWDRKNTHKQTYTHTKKNKIHISRWLIPSIFPWLNVRSQTHTFSWQKWHKHTTAPQTWHILHIFYWVTFRTFLSMSRLWSLQAHSTSKHINRLLYSQVKNAIPCEQSDFSYHSILYYNTVTSWKHICTVCIMYCNCRGVSALGKRMTGLREIKQQRNTGTQK